MPTAPISMRKLKEIIRLKYGCELTHRQIAKACLYHRALFQPMLTEQLNSISLAGL